MMSGLDGAGLAQARSLHVTVHRVSFSMTEVKTFLRHDFQLVRRRPCLSRLPHLRELVIRRPSFPRSPNGMQPRPVSLKGADEPSEPTTTKRQEESESLFPL
jgi:hypothetical protein